jgi:hypothetical protein
MVAVEKAIDRALAIKKVRLVLPRGNPTDSETATPKY